MVALALKKVKTNKQTKHEKSRGTDNNYAEPTSLMFNSIAILKKKYESHSATNEQQGRKNLELEAYLTGIPVRKIQHERYGYNK